MQSIGRSDGIRIWISVRKKLRTQDTLAEWLRRWPAKPLCSARVGSNPTGVDAYWTCVRTRSDIPPVMNLRAHAPKQYKLLAPRIELGTFRV